MAWKIWAICDRHGRPPGYGVVTSIEIKAVIDTCRAYDAYLEDFEKVLLVENIIYPKMVEKIKREASEREASEKSKRKNTR